MWFCRAVHHPCLVREFSFKSTYRFVQIICKRKLWQKKTSVIVKLPSHFKRPASWPAVLAVVVGIPMRACYRYMLSVGSLSVLPLANQAKVVACLQSVCLTHLFLPPNLLHQCCCVARFQKIFWCGYVMITKRNEGRQNKQQQQQENTYYGHSERLLWGKGKFSG